MNGRIAIAIGFVNEARVEEARDRCGFQGRLTSLLIEDRTRKIDREGSRQEYKGGDPSGFADRLTRLIEERVERRSKDRTRRSHRRPINKLVDRNREDRRTLSTTGTARIRLGTPVNKQKTSQGKAESVCGSRSTVDRDATKEAHRRIRNKYQGRMKLRLPSTTG